MHIVLVLAAVLMAISVVGAAPARLGDDSEAPTMLFTDFTPQSATTIPGRVCSAGANPLINSAAFIFTVYNCQGMNGDYGLVYHIDLDQSKSTLLLNISTVPHGFFRRSPVALNLWSAIVQTDGGYVALVDPIKQVVWSRNRASITSDIALAAPEGMVWFSDNNDTAVVGLNASTGVQVATYNPASNNNGRGVALNETINAVPVYKEGVIYVLNGETLSAISAATGMLFLRMFRPCGMKMIDGGFPLTMQIIQFGSDTNGPLEAFIIHGTTINASTQGPTQQLSICRIHHYTPGSTLFGTPEWSMAYGGGWKVDAVTGGAGALFFSLTGTGNWPEYKVLQVNVSLKAGQNVPDTVTTSRSMADVQSYPAVIYPSSGDPTVAPQILLQLNGNLVRINAWTNVHVAVDGVGCTFQPVTFTVGSTNRYLCLGVGTGKATQYNFEGELEWTYDVWFPRFPPIVLDSVAVFFQARGIFGLSISRHVPSTPIPAPAPSAPTTTIVVLIIALAFLVVAAGVVMWKASAMKAIKNRVAGSQRTEQAELNKEGYASLNA